MKKLLAIAAAGGIVVVAAAVWYGVTTRPLAVEINGAKFSVSVARTETARERGLSGTSEIAADHAMLFVFPADGTWGFWMKDMSYPIDIVWLDSSQTVNYVVEGASPASYPKIFTPPKPARYVAELKAGTVKQKRITIGTRAQLDAALKEPL